MRMRCVWTIVLAMLVCAAPIQAQAPVQTRPKTPPMTLSETQQTMRQPSDVAAKIDALFAEQAKPGNPGAAVGVYRDGKLIFSKGYGLADLEAGTAITTKTRFHVASVSKQFAAFAVALLAREGKLDLDADVRNYLPYLPNFGRKISTRHLILHTSGLRDQWALFALGGQDMDGRLRQAQIVNMVSRQRALNFDPGSEHMYSNTGYTLLAEIVRAVSGQSLREFTSERIFTPLAMGNTFFFDDVEEVVPGRANSYEREKDDQPWKRSLLNYDNAGATSLFTTVEDLAKWAGNFSAPRVGDRALIDQVTSNGSLDDGTPLDYGFALSRTKLDGRSVITHSGADAGFRAMFYVYPDDDFAIIITANTPFDLTEKVKAIADLYLPPGKSPLPPPPAARPNPDLAKKFAGTYLPRYGGAFKLREKNGELHPVEDEDEETEALVLRADGSFDDGKRDYHYYVPIINANGQVEALEEHTVGTPYPPVQRLQRASALPASDLSGYVGDYRSDELDITYTVKLDGGQLQVESLWTEEPIALQMVAPHRFDAEDWRFGSIVFDEQSNQPQYFMVNSGRIRHLRFDRVPQRAAPSMMP